VQEKRERERERERKEKRETAEGERVYRGRGWMERFRNISALASVTD